MYVRHPPPDGMCGIHRQHGGRGGAPDNIAMDDTTLPPDQERRLRQQHKKRTAELGRAREAGGNKEAELLSTLQAQAQRCDKAQREAAKATKVAAGGLAATEAELGGARKKSGVLETLSKDLQSRQGALLQKKQALLASEDEQREQLSVAFKDKIGAVQTKLAHLSEQRAVQTAESDRLRAELEVLRTAPQPCTPTALLTHRADPQPHAFAPTALHSPPPRPPHRAESCPMV